MVLLLDTLRPALPQQAQTDSCCSPHPQADRPPNVQGDIGVKVIDYGLPCTELYRKELDRFLEWLSCCVQNWGSLTEIERQVAQYLRIMPDSEIWILWTGMHALSSGKRCKRRRMTGWDIVIQDLPFLRSEVWRRQMRYLLGRKLLIRGMLELNGHLPPGKKWRPSQLRATLLSTKEE